MVHRQLQTVLALDALGVDLTDPESVAFAATQQEVSHVEAQLDECNKLKKKSREVQESCDVSFFCIYLRNRKEVDLSTATVMSVTEKCLNVYVPKLNKACPIWFKLTSKVPDWFLSNDPKRAELEEIVSGPHSFTFVSESEVVVRWQEDGEDMKIRQYDKLPIVIVPLTTLLLPPHHPLYNEPILQGEPPE